MALIGRGVAEPPPLGNFLAIALHLQVCETSVPGWRSVSGALVGLVATFFILLLLFVLLHGFVMIMRILRILYAICDDYMCIYLHLCMYV